MKSQEVLDYLDHLVFNQTGKHLDNLQFSILKGLSNGKKYPDIAKEYNCSKGHVRDSAYELWRILSKALGEDINKSNFYATVERLNLSNSQSFIGNQVIDNINFCPNSAKEETVIDDNLENNNQNLESTDHNFSQRCKDANFSNHKNNYQVIIEQAQKQVKLETVPKLLKIGLTVEQIAQMLELELEEIKEIML